jgi:hypothetical protein
VRFQDAAPDARAIVYAGIQADPLVARAAELLTRAGPGERLLARTVMNGETTDAAAWRAMFPGLFPSGAAEGVGAGAETGAGAGAGAGVADLAEAILEVSLAVAGRGEEARSQFRGAIVEALTARLLAARVPASSVHRERRILFDGVRAEIHPYDVTVELPERAEVYDCKWGARGINADVLLQLDAARTNAETEGGRIVVALVVFDARRSCRVRLARQTVPLSGVRLVALESLDALGRARATAPAATSPAAGAPAAS